MRARCVLSLSPVVLNYVDSIARLIRRAMLPDQSTGKMWTMLIPGGRRLPRTGDERSHLQRSRRQGRCALPDISPPAGGRPLSRGITVIDLEHLQPCLLRQIAPRMDDVKLVQRGNVYGRLTA